MASIKCNIVLTVRGKQFRNEENITVLTSFDGGPMIDMRQGSFVQILPCPWCGVHEDRAHDPLAHVNPKLGTPNSVKVKAA